MQLVMPERGHAFTRRGMHRTFNDLCRAARVEDVAPRSISGRLTERMQHHYSTVRGDEQRASIAKVIELMTAREARAPRTAEVGLVLYVRDIAPVEWSLVASREGTAAPCHSCEVVNSKPSAYCELAGMG